MLPGKFLDMERDDQIGDPAPEIRLERTIRETYEAESIYKTGTICHRLRADSREYHDRLLAAKFELVRRHCVDGLLVDLCCATGAHLFALADLSGECLGLDFSRPFVASAAVRAVALDLGHVRFAVADATSLPLSENSIATLYSFSALYAIPRVERVIEEIARVLRPGGRCVLDLGNSRSINAICVKAYTELPPTFHLTVAEMEAMCRRYGLEIIERRSFQLLPLWADKPRWLWPLLHPGWKRLMSIRLGGRMIDEWISGAPLLNRFAFRQVLVCEKRHDARLKVS